MRYEVILEKGDYALIVRGTNLDEYAVVHYLDKENKCWGATCRTHEGYDAYWNFGIFGGDKTKCLFEAIDCFRYKTEENYIPYSRMEDIARDGINAQIEAEPDESAYYFRNNMNESELDFFGLNENGYRKEYE